jgi:peroxiredoxin
MNTIEKSILLISATIALMSCGNKKNNGSFELKGKLINTNGETIYLEKLSSTQPIVVDSALINDAGEFEFIQYQPKIGFYRIKLNAQNFAMLVLDSADKVNITGDLKDLANTYKTEGSPETKLFLEYQDIAKMRDMRLDSLNKVFQMLMEGKKMDNQRMDSISELFKAPYEAIVNPSNEHLGEKIKQNNNMYASIMAIQALETDKFVSVYEALDKGLTSKFPEDRNVKMFHDVFVKAVASSIGQVAPEINLPSLNGTEIKLSSLKGKIVLIDFWASWCGPCRKEMPNVVKAYAKFKSKGFEIYGVSLDDSKDRWEEAVAKDGITWPQVSDLRKWDGEVVRNYNINSIPFTVLLDRDGKIIAKNLRGEELEKKLVEVLN